MNDNLVPHDKRLHFGCGFVFGGVLVFLFLLELIVRHGLSAWLAVIAAGLLTGFLARRHGEAFWARSSSVIETVSKWLRHS